MIHNLVFESGTVASRGRHECEIRDAAGLSEGMRCCRQERAKRETDARMGGMRLTKLTSEVEQWRKKRKRASSSSSGW